MPGPSFDVVYTIAPFSGTPNAVTSILPTAVSVNPAPTPGQPSVQADPASGAGAIKVVGGAVNMNITITDGSRTNTYYPVGLAVQQNNARTRPMSTFPPATSVDTTISLGDNDNAPGLSYEFVVMFQDLNGYFGALDPRISNM